MYLEVDSDLFVCIKEYFVDSTKSGLNCMLYIINSSLLNFLFNMYTLE